MVVDMLIIVRKMDKSGRVTRIGMSITDVSVAEFVEVLGSNSPAPGGGSAAALVAVTGISLTKMVYELTVGREKYAAFEAENQRAFEQTKKLQASLLKAVEEDVQVFKEVSAVFAMPKETQEQKKVRQLEMQSALKKATKAPFSLMELTIQSLEITQQAINKSNPNVASDLGVAALNLKAGLQGAWVNVLINLGNITEEEFVVYYRQAGESLLTKGCVLADEIYESIVKSITEK